MWLVGSQWPSSDYSHSTYAVHWDGEEWTVAASPSSGTRGSEMLRVSGIPGGHVWATGYWLGSMLLRWTGSYWDIAYPEAATENGWYLSDIEVIAPDDAS